MGTIIKQIKRTIKEESASQFCLRVLKVVSIKLHRFILTIPLKMRRLFKNKVCKKINTYKMNLYLDDKGIAQELFVYGKREFFGTDLLYDIVKEDDIVLDIGANIGYFVLIESQLVGPKGKVYAVEPSHINFERLQENIELNQCQNINCYNLAMGDKNGKAKMFISNRSNWSRLIEIEVPDKINQVIEVDQQKVDTFLEDKEKPTFIRMDVEGYEAAILKGMTETLKLENLSVFLELHPTILKPHDIISIFEIFKNNGFQTKYCFLNPMLDRNPLIGFSYKKLGEYDFYKGRFFDFNLRQAKEWALNTKFMKCPHFLFHKEIKE